nr:hypothetical protein [Vibrio sonorensis]
MIKHRPVSVALKKYVGETGTETEQIYEPGKESIFRVVLTNNNEAFASGIKIKDLINSLEVDTVKGTREKAFDTWTITVNTGNPLTSVSPDPSGMGKDIDARVDLAPNDTVEFLIRGVVNEYASGRIDNKATMSVTVDGSSKASAEASLLAAEENVVVTKTADNPIYVAGEKSTFRVRLVNDSKGFAQNIVVRDVMSNIKVPTRPDITTGKREVVPAFTDWVIEQTQQDPRTQVSQSAFAINSDIDVVMSIAPQDTVEFAITGTVDPRAMGEIVNVAQEIEEAPVSRKTSGEYRVVRAGANVTTVSAMITPQPVHFAIDKTTNKGDDAEFTNDDETLTYILKVTNEGSGTVSGAEMLDEVSQLVGSNGNALFTDWTVKIEEWPTGDVKAEFSNQDLNLPDSGLSLDLLPYMGNGYEITIVGQLNKGLDDTITNTFTVTDQLVGNRLRTMQLFT